MRWNFHPSLLHRPQGEMRNQADSRIQLKELLPCSEFFVAEVKQYLTQGDLCRLLSLNHDWKMFQFDWKGFTLPTEEALQYAQHSTLFSELQARMANPHQQLSLAISHPTTLTLKTAWGQGREVNAPLFSHCYSVTLEGMIVASLEGIVDVQRVRLVDCFFRHLPESVSAALPAFNISDVSKSHNRVTLSPHQCPHWTFESCHYLRQITANPNIQFLKISRCDRIASAKEIPFLPSLSLNAVTSIEISISPNSKVSPGLPFINRLTVDGEYHASDLLPAIVALAPTIGEMTLLNFVLLQNLTRLSALIKLELDNCLEIEEVNGANFPSLKACNLRYMKKLSLVKDFPCLSRLLLENCPLHVTVRNCPQLKEMNILSSRNVSFDKTEFPLLSKVSNDKRVRKRRIRVREHTSKRDPPRYSNKRNKSTY